LFERDILLTAIGNALEAIPAVNCVLSDI
jgi:hypothetical protein